MSGAPIRRKFPDLDVARHEVAVVLEEVLRERLASPHIAEHGEDTTIAARRRDEIETRLHPHRELGRRSVSGGGPRVPLAFDDHGRLRGAEVEPIRAALPVKPDRDRVVELQGHAAAGEEALHEPLEPRAAPW